MAEKASLLMQELLDENLAKFAEFFKNALLTKFVTFSSSSFLQDNSCLFHFVASMQMHCAARRSVFFIRCDSKPQDPGTNPQPAATSLVHYHPRGLFAPSHFLKESFFD